jgi:hypothetical protein
MLQTIIKGLAWGVILSYTNCYTNPVKTKAYRRVEKAVEERYASHLTPDKP